MSELPDFQIMFLNSHITCNGGNEYDTRSISLSFFFILGFKAATNRFKSLICRSFFQSLGLCPLKDRHLSKELRGKYGPDLINTI